MSTQQVRSIPELFSAATDWRLGGGDGDWTAVSDLHEIASREVLDRALELMTASDPRRRARAADILGQLGLPKRAFPEECLAAVIHLATHETDPDVLRAAAAALGHLVDPRSTSTLARMANSEEPELRQAVATALGGRSTPEAIATLIRLAGDPIADVREWATFGLGELGTLDTPEVRTTLHRRLDDDDPEVRYEAIRGLARCGDLRAVESLIDALGDQPHNLSLFPAAKVLLNLPHEYGSLTAADLIDGLRSLVATRGAA